MPTKKCPYCSEEIQDEAIKCKHCGTWLQSPPGGVLAESAAPPGNPWTGRLVRSTRQRMFSGVCGGLGEMFGLDPTLVRILYVAATIFSGVLPGLLVYAVCAFVIPRDDAPML